MAMTPETQKMLMDTLRVSQPQSIAAPLSPFEQIEAQRGLLSTDPVVANLQKLGRGVVGFLSPQTPLDYLTMAIPGAKLAKGASGVRRFQWMANKEGGQKIGNMEEIRPLTKDVFDKEVKPRIASDMSYQEYITKFPNLKASFISKDGGKSFKFSRIDDEANLTVEPQNPIWRKEVDSFDSPTATKQRMTADSDVVSKNINSIVDKYKDKGVQLSVFENPNSKTIYLSKIIVDNKKQGLGTKAMDDLISYADKTQQTITLTPSLDYGASSIKRLKDFYKRFDFVENKGRNKDFEFRDTMYRTPK